MIENKTSLCAVTVEPLFLNNEDMGKFYNQLCKLNRFTVDI